MDGGRLRARAFRSGSRQRNIAGAITRCQMSKIRVRGGVGGALSNFYGVYNIRLRWGVFLDARN